MQEKNSVKDLYNNFLRLGFFTFKLVLYNIINDKEMNVKKVIIKNIFNRYKHSYESDVVAEANNPKLGAFDKLTILTTDNFSKESFNPFLINIEINYSINPLVINYFKNVSKK